MTVPTVKRKVLAYITHGHRLLVFSHPHFPEAGIQVPAGTVKDDESLEEAALREALEETGLPDLELGAFLGQELRDMAEWGLDQIHDRYFFHLRCTGNPPETWQHFETDPSDGTPEPILFEFFWADLPHGVPELTGHHAALLPELIKRLSL